MINSIMPTLIAYGGLRELTLQVYGERYPDFQELTLITEHQPVLHTLSISSDVKGTPKFPEKHFISWLHTCYKKPTLQYLKLSIDPISVKFLIQVLTDFISTPCSHEQTLIIKHFPREPCIRKKCSRRLEPAAIKRAVKLPPLPPPKPIHSSKSRDILTTPIHQFDDVCTMKYKCLTFDSHWIGPLFTKGFLELAPLNLKNMSLLNSSTLSEHLEICPLRRYISY